MLLRKNELFTHDGQQWKESSEWPIQTERTPFRVLLSHIPNHKAEHKYVYLLK